jgi:hypothetical protein
MPPQGYLIGGGLAWNLARSLRGESTISQLCRRHRALTFAVVGGALGWFVPHILKES